MCNTRVARAFINVYNYIFFLKCILNLQVADSNLVLTEEDKYNKAPKASPVLCLVNKYKH